MDTTTNTLEQYLTDETDVAAIKASLVKSLRQAHKAECYCAECGFRLTDCELSEQQSYCYDCRDTMTSTYF